MNNLNDGNNFLNCGADEMKHSRTGNARGTEDIKNYM